MATQKGRAQEPPHGLSAEQALAALAVIRTLPSREDKMFDDIMAMWDRRLASRRENMPDNPIEEVPSLLSVIVEESKDVQPPPVEKSPLTWHTFSQRKDAVIEDEQSLKNEDCLCLVNKEKNQRACFSESALGVLSEEQSKLCGSIQTRDMPEEVRQLMEAAGECSGGMGEWISCMIQKVPEFGK